MLILNQAGFQWTDSGPEFWQIRPVEKLKTIAVNEAMEGVCKIYEEQLKKDSSEQYLAFFSSLNIFSSLRIFGAQLLNEKKGKFFSTFDYIRY